MYSLDQSYDHPKNIEIPGHMHLNQRSGHSFLPFDGVLEEAMLYNDFDMERMKPKPLWQPNSKLLPSKSVKKKLKNVKTLKKEHQKSINQSQLFYIQQTKL